MDDAVADFNILLAKGKVTLKVSWLAPRKFEVSYYRDGKLTCGGWKSFDVRLFPSLGETLVPRYTYKTPDKPPRPQ